MRSWPSCPYSSDMPDRMSTAQTRLTRETIPAYVVRRDIMYQERPKEDLLADTAACFRFYSMQFHPVAFLMNPSIPFGSAHQFFALREWAHNLSRTAQDPSPRVSDRVKHLAKEASRKISDVIEAGEAVILQLARNVEPPAAPGGHVAAQAEDVSFAYIMETMAANPCVRLFHWMRRHNISTRVTRWNLEARLRVLAAEAQRSTTPEEKLESSRTLLEREVPTAIGPFANIPENQNYTNHFFLLRDNAHRKLEEVPALTFADFDVWALKYPGLVRATPWDHEYVPPWDPNWAAYHEKRFARPERSTAERGGIQKRSNVTAPPGTPDKRADDDRTRALFNVALAGIAIFSVALVLVASLLIRECRRRPTHPKSKQHQLRDTVSSGEEEGKESDNIGLSRGRALLTSGPLPAHSDKDGLLAQEGVRGRGRGATLVLEVRDNQDSMASWRWHPSASVTEKGKSASASVISVGNRLTPLWSVRAPLPSELTGFTTEAAPISTEDTPLVRAPSPSPRTSTGLTGGDTCTLGAGTIMHAHE